MSEYANFYHQIVSSSVWGCAFSNKTLSFPSVVNLPELELLTFSQLIHQLYRPGAPEKVVKIQETLQRLQRSPEGWKLAISLLENKDEQVKFFGALTFTVKLNTDA